MKHLTVTILHWLGKPHNRWKKKKSLVELTLLTACWRNQLKKSFHCLFPKIQYLAKLMTLLQTQKRMKILSTELYFCLTNGLIYSHGGTCSLACIHLVAESTNHQKRQDCIWMLGNKHKWYWAIWYGINFSNLGLSWNDYVALMV